jgi:hypothetical protein
MTVENGVIEKEIQGKTVGFKFGTYTFKVIRQLTGIEVMEDVFRKLTVNNNVEFLVSFLQACAIHYAKEKGQNSEITEEQVCDWMDEIGLADSRMMIMELIKAFTVKNLKAPVTAGQDQPA